MPGGTPLSAEQTETFVQRRERLKREAAQAAQQQLPPTEPRLAVVLDAGHGRASRWAAVKHQQTLADLLAVQPGGRNHALNAAAYSLGRLCPKWLDEHQVSLDLDATAARIGLGEVERRATITSGLHSGMKDPRDPPVDEIDHDGLRSLLHPDQRLAVQVPQQGGLVRADDAYVDPATGEVLARPQALQGAPGVAGEEFTWPAFVGLDLAALDAPLPPLDWLVEGRITRGSLTLLGSKPGIGKSWLAQALALAVATGGTWLGHQALPGVVLYLDAENGDRLALRRLQQLGASHGQLAGQLVYVTESIVFPEGRDVGRLRATLEQVRPDLVVVDTLASIAPTAEAGTEEASRFFSTVWHAVRDSGAAMVLLCHLRKVAQGAGKDDPLASFRGAGHLVGAAHRAWVLDPVAEGKFILRDVKSREYAALDPVRIRLVDSGAGEALRTAVEVEGTVAQVEDGYDAFLSNVLTFIDRHPTGCAKTKDLLGLSSSETSRTLERYLDRALAAGIVAKPRRGEWCRAVGTAEPLDGDWS